MSGNTPSLTRLSPIRVLVTGGAGYIGSHTAKLLARSGFEPVVLDNLSTGHRWAVKWGPMIEGDLSDAGLIREVIGAYKVRAVIHFAASAYVGESMKSPRKYFRNNVANALNLLGINVGGLRLPLVEANEKERGIVRAALADYGLL